MFERGISKAQLPQAIRSRIDARPPSPQAQGAPVPRAHWAAPPLPPWAGTPAR